MTTDLQISAFYYPGYHPTPENDAQIRPGWTEWEMVKSAKPHYEGHYQPRIPMWGYEDESRVEVMRRKLETAQQYGIGNFHFVWYWYERRPFMERALEVGYLNSRPIQPGPTFSILWANHDRMDGFPESTSGPQDLLATTDYTRLSLELMVDHWICHYFSSPYYFRLPDRSLFVSIHYVSELISRGGGDHAVGRFIEMLRTRVSAAGLGAVHLNTTQGYFFESPQLLERLGFDSVTNYATLGYTESFNDYDAPGSHSNLNLPNYAGERNRPAAGRLKDVVKTWQWTAEQTGLPYFPVATVGRDCSSRVDGPARPEHLGRYGNRVILDDATPDLFREELAEARSFLRAPSRPIYPPLLFINSWNEWTESAYLEPDQRFRYAFLEEVSLCQKAWENDR